MKKRITLTAIFFCLNFISGCIWPFSTTIRQPSDSTDMQKPNRSDSRWAFPPNSSNDRVIVFVHGIFGDAFSTWKNPEGKYFFDFMKSDPSYDHTDLYVYGFPSSFFGTAFSIDQAVSGLNQRLKDDHVLDHKQIIFVCHSMGGLVVQRYLLTYRITAQKVPLLFFYSTPQEGAAITRVATIVTNNPGIEQMFPYDKNRYLQNLDGEWKQALAEGLKTEIRCAYETEPTFGVVIVGAASGTRNCFGVSTAVGENHINIVKIKNSRDMAYVALRNAVSDIPAPQVTSDSGEAPWLNSAKGMPQLNADFMRLTKSTADVKEIKEELVRLRQPHLDLISIMKTAQGKPSSLSRPSQLVSLYTYLAMAYYQLAAIAKYRALDEIDTQVARKYHEEAIGDAESCVVYADSGIDLYDKILNTDSAILSRQMGIWSENRFEESKQKLQEYHYSFDLKWYRTAARAILSYYDKVPFKDAYDEVLTLKAIAGVKDPPTDDPTMKWVLASKDGERPQRDQNTDMFLESSSTSTISK